MFGLDFASNHQAAISGHFPRITGGWVRYHTDVLIIGGGPAGLATALASRAKGLTVLVADGSHPPITKACGEGLLPDAVAALRKLGVALGARDGYLLHGIRFEDEDSSIQAQFPGGLGLGVRREVLHQRMVERAQECGVRFAWNTAVTGLAVDGVIAAGEKIRAKWVVAADGDRSRVRAWAGLDDSECSAGRLAWRQHYRAKAWANVTEVHWSADAQAYVTPVSAEEICVAFISRTRHVRVGEGIQLFPRLAQRLESAPLLGATRGAVTRMCQLSAVARGNIALVGDASGTVDAISGEGLSLAFRQALTLADTLQRDDLRHYEREHRRLSRRPRFVSNLLLFLATRRRIRRRTFQAMRAAPNIFDCLLAYHVGETRLFELAASGAQFSWRFLTV
jgi:menaquinone-9 beta-reductase